MLHSTAHSTARSSCLVCTSMDGSTCPLTILTQPLPHTALPHSIIKVPNPHASDKRQNQTCVCCAVLRKFTIWGRFTRELRYMPDGAVLARGCDVHALRYSAVQRSLVPESVVVIPLTRLDIAAARGGTTFYPAMEHLHSGSCLSDLQQLLCAACASSIRINSAAGGCVGLDWWKDHLSSASYGPDTPIVLVLHGLSGADQSCMLSRFRDLAISL